MCGVGASVGNVLASDDCIQKERFLSLNIEGARWLFYCLPVFVAVCLGMYCVCG